MEWTRAWRAVSGVAQEATLIATVIVFALAIWFVITDTENREIEERLGFSLSVEAINLASNLAVGAEALPVSVTVVGKRADVEAARVEDFRATVDLADRAAGRHSLPVRVESLNADLRVRAVLPETAAVILEAVEAREVPVRVELANPPPLGFSVGEPIVEPATATVSGIAEEVDAVDVVIARLDLASATVPVDRDVSLEARTAGGVAVGRVAVNPGFARVSVPVTQEVYRRSFAVRPRLSGAPLAGYRVVSVRVDPATIELIVGIDAFDDEAVIDTLPVNIEGRSEGLVVRVALDLSGGATPAGADSVQVIVAVEPIPGTVQLPAPLTTTGLADGARLASISADTVELTLSGPIALLSELVAPLSPIEIDLSRLGPGRHTVTVEAQAPAGARLERILPDRVTVVILALPPPPPVADGDNDIDSDSGSAQDEPADEGDGENDRDASDASSDQDDG